MRFTTSSRMPRLETLARGVKSASFSQWIWYAALLVAGIRLAITGYALSWANALWLFADLPDDAYYYLEVGQRIARGEGSTLDGIHRTNGYHPLWQGIVSLLALVWRGDELTRAALVVELMCFAGAVLLIGALVRRWLGGLVAALVVLMATTFTLTFLNGMETAVELLLLAIVCWALGWYARGASRRRAIVLGVACGGLVLARLDLLAVIWLVPAAALLLTRRDAGRARIARYSDLVAWFCGLAALVAPWAVFSWIEFSSPFPVSASVKSWRVGQSIDAAFGSRWSMGYGDQILRNLKPLLLQTWYRAVPIWSGFGRLAYTAAALVLFVGASWFARRQRNRQSSPSWRTQATSDRPSGWALAVGGSIAGLALLLSVVVVPGPWLLQWYPASWWLLAAVLAAALVGGVLRRLSRRAPHPIVRGVAVLALLALVALWGTSRNGLLNGDTQPPGFSHHGTSAAANDLAVQRSPFLAAAVWLASEAPPGRVGAFDNGYLSFYADPRPVTNLDGLANDREFFSAMRDPDGSLLETYRLERIRYLVTIAFPSRIPSCARLIWSSPATASFGADLAGGAPSAAEPFSAYDLAPCGDSGPKTPSN